MIKIGLVDTDVVLDEACKSIGYKKRENRYDTLTTIAESGPYTLFLFDYNDIGNIDMGMGTILRNCIDDKINELRGFDRDEGEDHIQTINDIQKHLLKGRALKFAPIIHNSRKLILDGTHRLIAFYDLARKSQLPNPQILIYWGKAP